MQAKVMSHQGYSAVTMSLRRGCVAATPKSQIGTFSSRRCSGNYRFRMLTYSQEARIL